MVPDPKLESEQPTVDVDQGWKLLSLVNEWVRFADAKAGATLAFAGAMGTMLYNLTRDPRSTGWPVWMAVVLTCLCLFAAVLLAGYAIAPRTHDREAASDRPSRLFFASIASRYKGQRAGFREELAQLASDPARLLEELADQIHANSQIAATKTKLVKWAVRTALCGAVLLAAVTILVSITSPPG